MSENLQKKQEMNKASFDFNGRNFLIGILSAIAFELMVTELLVNPVNRHGIEILDRFGEPLGWVIINWVRDMSIFAVLGAVNAAASVPRHTKISHVITWAFLGYIGGTVIAGIASVVTTVLFGQAGGTPVQRIVISIVFGGALGALWGLVLATFAKVRGARIGFKQYLMTMAQIDRATMYSMLRWATIGLWLMASAGLAFVTLSFWGIALGIAGIGVIAIILVNKYNSTRSESGG